MPWTPSSKYRTKLHLTDIRSSQIFVCKLFKMSHVNVSAPEVSERASSFVNGTYQHIRGHSDVVSS